MADLVQPTSQVPRDRYGRPWIRDQILNKLVTYRRVTTHIDVLENRYNLELWQQRMVALGLASRSDLLMKAASVASDKNQLNKVVEEAREAGGATQAATMGTALHSLTEQIDRGQEPLIPPSAQPDIDAYTQLLRDHRISISEIEVFVVHDGYRVGGTFDRIIEIDGHRYVADIKTGTIDWSASKIAMQLALYANSVRYEHDPSNPKRSVLNVDTTRGAVIHLPAASGEATLHWADLEAGLQGVQLAERVWRWRDRSGLLEATSPSGDVLTTLIGMCGDEQSLVDLWKQYIDSWTEHHTKAATERKEVLRKEVSPLTASVVK